MCVRTLFLLFDCFGSYHPRYEILRRVFSCLVHGWLHDTVHCCLCVLFAPFYSETVEHTSVTHPDYGK